MSMLHDSPRPGMRVREKMAFPYHMPHGTGAAPVAMHYVQTPTAGIPVYASPVPIYHSAPPPPMPMYVSPSNTYTPSYAPYAAAYYSRDAKRPFSSKPAYIDDDAQSSASEATRGFDPGHKMEADDDNFQKGTMDEDQKSLMEDAKIQEEKKKQSFFKKLKFWQKSKTENKTESGTTANVSYQVTYPGQSQTGDRIGTHVPPAGAFMVMNQPQGSHQNCHFIPEGQGIVIEEIAESVDENLSPMEDAQTVVSKLPPGEFIVPLEPAKAQVRWRSSTPVNTVMMFVPQQEAWVVERMGKFYRILDPGVNFLIPVLDKVKYVQSLKEIAIDIPKQTAITRDNVTLNIDGVLYLRIVDPYRASYGVEDPEFAITQLAQTTMRSDLGKISLDNVFRERESLNALIVESINKASEAWGISCLRYEIRDIRLPARVQEAMQMQVEAERKKRAAILESEGMKAAEINIAEGKKQSRILASEAEKMEQINKAEGMAAAMLAKAEARAKSLKMVSVSLSLPNGMNSASLDIAEQYVTAFQQLARTNNTLILPSNTNDVTGMVAQAMTIYNQLSSSNNPLSQEQAMPSGSIAPFPVAAASPQDVVADAVAEYHSDDEEPPTNVPE